MPTVELLVPTSKSTVGAVAPAPRRGAPRRVALLHNGQPIFDQTAPLIIEALQAAGLEVTSFRKPRYSSPAEDAVYEHIAAETEAAIVGLAC